MTSGHVSRNTSRLPTSLNPGRRMLCQLKEAGYTSLANLLVEQGHEEAKRTFIEDMTGHLLSHLLHVRKGAWLVLMQLHVSHICQGVAWCYLQDTAEDVTPIEIHCIFDFIRKLSGAVHAEEMLSSNAATAQQTS